MPDGLLTDEEFIGSSAPSVSPITEELLDAHAMAESGNRDNIVSDQGAIGRHQLLPAVAKERGVDPRNAKQSREAARAILTENLQRFGNLDDALMAYHAGVDGMTKHLAGQPQSVSGVGPKTKAYPDRVKGFLKTAAAAPAPAGEVSDEDFGLLDDKAFLGAEPAEVGDQAFMGGDASTPTPGREGEVAAMSKVGEPGLSADAPLAGAPETATEAVKRYFSPDAKVPAEAPYGAAPEVPPLDPATTELGKGVQTGITGLKSMGVSALTVPVIGAIKTHLGTLDAFDAVDAGQPPPAEDSFAANRARMYAAATPEVKGQLRARAEAQMAGSKDFKDGLLAAWKGFEEEMKATQGRVPNFTDIRDLNDFKDYFQFTVGQTFPYMAAMVLGGVLAGMPGVIASSYLMGVGDTEGDLIKAGREEEGGRALLGAVPYAALDFLGPVGRAFRGVPAATLKQVAEAWAKRAGKEVTANVVEEFVNEAGQDIVKDIAVKSGTGEPIVTGESLLQWFNSGMGGAVSALLPGAGHAVHQRISEAPQRAQTAEAKPPEGRVWAEPRAGTEPFLDDKGVQIGWRDPANPGKFSGTEAAPGRGLDYNGFEPSGPQEGAGTETQVGTPPPAREPAAVSEEAPAKAAALSGGEPPPAPAKRSVQEINDDLDMFRSALAEPEVSDTEKKILERAVAEAEAEKAALSQGADLLQPRADGVVSDAKAATDFSEGVPSTEEILRASQAPADLASLKAAIAAPRQSVEDGGVGETEGSRYVADIHTLLDQGYRALDVPSRRRVLPGVLAAIQDPEVLRDVVSTLPISMVDDLGGGQGTGEALLHDSAMFVNALATKSNLAVGADVVDAIVRRLAASVVKVLPENQAGRLPDGAAAPETGKGDGQGATPEKVVGQNTTSDDAETPLGPKPSKPQDILQFIAQTGGIWDEGGELHAMDLHLYKPPGHAKLVLGKGPDMQIDALDRGAKPRRPMAVLADVIEAGFLPEDATVGDLYEAMGATRVGKPVYRAEDIPQAQAREEWEQARKDRQEQDHRLRQMAEDHGIDHRGLSPKKLRAAINERAREIEAAEAAMHQAIEAIKQEHENADGPEFDPPYSSVADPRAEAPAAPGEVGAEGVSADARPADDGHPEERGGGEEAAAAEATGAIDETDQGKQRVIPGAEKKTAEETAAAADAAKMARKLEENRIERAQSKSRRGNQESVGSQKGGLFDAEKPLLQAEDEKTADESADPVSPEFRSRAAQVQEQLERIAKKLFPGLRIEITEKPTIETVGGRTTPALGTYSVEGLARIASIPLRNQRGVLRSARQLVMSLGHEGIHYLVEMGVISPKDALVLERAVKAQGWKSRFNIDTRYRGLSEEEKAEEAIADAFGAYQSGQLEVPSGIRAIFDRIGRLLEAFGNWLRGNGFRSYRDVFRDVSSGALLQKKLPATMRQAIAVNEKRLKVHLDSITPRPASFGRALDQAQKGMDRQTKKLAVAYHGSPHNFDEFTTEKIGTGEGNQTYGWGLYFAGKREVAEHYRPNLSLRSFINKARDAYDQDSSPAEAEEALREEDLSSDQRDLLDALKADDWLGFDYPHQAIASIMREPEANDPSERTKLAAKNLGRLYQVDLAPKEDEYLDWDKPLSEQSEKVKAALAKARLAQAESPETTAGKWYKSFTDARQGEADPKWLSQALAAAGIPGIRYLDKGSRAEGAGTSNYVIFDNKSVRQTKKLMVPTGDLEGGEMGPDRLAPDIGLPTDIFIHPRTIATLKKDFTAVYMTAEHQQQIRDGLVFKYRNLGKLYFDMGPEKRKKVDAALELGALQYEVYGGDNIKMTNRGEHDAGHAALSKVGDVIHLDKEQSRAYVAMRRMYDTALDDFRDQILRENGFDPSKPGQPKTSKELLTRALAATKAGNLDQAAQFRFAAKMVEEIEDAKSWGYVPFSRYGNVAIVVQRRVPVAGAPSMATGQKAKEWETVERRHFEVDGMMDRLKEKVGRATPFKDVPEIKAAMEELRKKYAGDPDIRIGDPHLMAPRNLETDIQLGDIDVLAEAAKIDDNQWEPIRTKIAHAIKSRTFKSHFFKRRQIAGYNTDFERVAADYIIGMSNYMARRQTREEWDKALGDIPATMPRLRKYAKDYHDYFQNPTEEMAALRQISFLWAIGPRISALLVNGTQPIITSIPHLAKFVPYHIAAKEQARASAQALGMLRADAAQLKEGNPFDFTKAPADVKAELLEMERDGQFLPVYTHEMLALAHNRSKRGSSEGITVPGIGHNSGAGQLISKATSAKTRQSAVQWAGAPFGMVERINRVTTAMAAIRIAKRLGNARIQKIVEKDPLAVAKLKDGSPLSFAEWSVDETQFRLGKVNRPRVGRGAGAPFMILRGFTANMFERQYKLAKLYGRKGRAEILLMGLGIFLFAGLQGQAGMDNMEDLLDWLMKKITGEDFDTRRLIREGLFKLTGSAAVAEALDQGLTRFLGVDTTKRVGIGSVPGLEILIHALTSKDMTVPLGDLSAPLGMTIGAVKEAQQKLEEDKPLSAAGAAMPYVLKDIIASNDWADDYTGGVRSARTGITNIPAESLSKWDIIQRAIGFTPGKVANTREAEYAKSRESQAVTELQADYARKLARAMVAQERAEEKGDKKAAARFEAFQARIVEEIENHNKKASDSRQVVVDTSRSSFQSLLNRERVGYEAIKGQTKTRGERAKIGDIYGVGVE